MPNPLHGGKRAPNKKLDPRRAFNMEAVLAVLPACKADIAKKSGLSRRTVYIIVRQMKQDGLIRVSGWIKHPRCGPDVPVFSAGNKPDAKNNLPRLTKAQSSMRYVNKIRGTDKHDQIKARQRNRHWLNKAATKPQSWLSALGGL